MPEIASTPNELSFLMKACSVCYLTAISENGAITKSFLNFTLEFGFLTVLSVVHARAQPDK